MKKVLMGIPADTPSHYQGRVEDLLSACFGANESVEVKFYKDVESFLEAYDRKDADLVIALDDIRFAGGYCEGIGKKTGDEKFILVIPSACKSDGKLLDLIRDGYFNILFHNDFTANEVANLIKKDRSLDEVMTYCNVDFRPAPQVHVPDVLRNPGSGEPRSQGERKPGSSIRKRYLGNGIGLIQLLGKDADVLNLKTVDEEEVDLDLFTGYDMTEIEKSASMPMRFYDVEPDWVEECKDKLKERFVKMGLLFFSGSFSDEEIEKNVLYELELMKITGDNAKMVLKSFLADIKSYGKIDILILDPDVSDVRLMNAETINVQCRGQWYRTNVKFRSKKEYESWILHVCNKNNVPFNLAAADIVFPDENSFPGVAMLRNSFTNANLNVDRNCSGHIRITRKIKKMMPELVKDGFITEAQASLLSNFVRQKKSMLICGGSGSGKTVLLNCLIEYLPRDICGEIVQESSELFAPHHLNIKSSNSIESKGTESRVSHDLKALSEKALLRNTDVFIIGEIKGDEAADFYTASRTTRVYSTLHANNCFGAIPRCAELAMAAAGRNLGKEELISVLARTIGAVVYCEHYKVRQIAEVKGYDEREKDVRYVLYDFDAKEEEYRK